MWFGTNLCILRVFLDIDPPTTAFKLMFYERSRVQESNREDPFPKRCSHHGHDAHDDDSWWNHSHGRTLVVGNQGLVAQTPSIGGQSQGSHSTPQQVSQLCATRCTFLFDIALVVASVTVAFMMYQQRKLAFVALQI
jgi:hypothetical protein